MQEFKTIKENRNSTKVISIPQRESGHKIKEILIGLFRYAGDYNWDTDKDWFVNQLKGLVTESFPDFTVADLSTSIKWGLDGKITKKKELTLQNVVSWFNYYSIIIHKYEASKSYNTTYEKMKLIFGNMDKLPLTKEALAKIKKSSVADAIREYKKANNIV